MAGPLRGCGAGALPVPLLLLLLLLPRSPATPGGECAAGGGRAGGGPEDTGLRPRAGDTWRDAGTVGPGQAEQGASGQDFFHSTFSPVSEAKGRNQDCNTGWELGVLQQFRETLEPRDESRARVKLFPLGPRKMVSLYPQTQASFTGGWWDGVLTACSPARADGSGRLHTWRT